MGRWSGCQVYLITDSAGTSVSEAIHYKAFLIKAYIGPKLLNDLRGLQLHESELGRGGLLIQKMDVLPRMAPQNPYHHLLIYAFRLI